MAEKIDPTAAAQREIVVRWLNSQKRPWTRSEVEKLLANLSPSAIANLAASASANRR